MVVALDCHRIEHEYRITDDDVDLLHRVRVHDRLCTTGQVANGTRFEDTRSRRNVLERETTELVGLDRAVSADLRDCR